MEYKKPALTYNQQLDLLITRGLRVNDRGKATCYLQNISYYRLSAYFQPFKQDENFKATSSFDDIVGLYTFDQKLRSLLLEAIEPIEIALRTHIIYHLSHKYGIFGYLDSSNFSKRFNHGSWLTHLSKSINESTEIFIQHYRKKYTTSQHLPLWMGLEVISFGGLSRLFKGLMSEDLRTIAAYYKLHDAVLPSWLHTLVYARNLCAHHSRLWNRTLAVKPLIPVKSAVWQNVDNKKVYCLLAIVKYFLDYINPHANWVRRLITLLEDKPIKFLTSMGFPADWSQQLLWGTPGASSSNKWQQTATSLDTA